MPFKKNDIVKFKNPKTVEEERALFSVVEDRETRILIELISNERFLIKPTEVVASSDLVLVVPAT